MKYFYLFMMTLFLCSCSSDVLLDEQTPQTHVGALSRKASHPASNTNNPYEDAGRLFDTLLGKYYDTVSLPVTVSGVVDRVNAIAQSDSLFSALAPLGYQPPLAFHVEAILLEGEDYPLDMIGQSGLSTEAKTRLATFLFALVAEYDLATDYSEVHEFIVHFEQETLDNLTLTSKDKEVLLACASISRYSAHRGKKKPKKKEDPEWDLLITNITAAAEGADHSICEAASLSLAVGIAGQK